MSWKDKPLAEMYNKCPVCAGRAYLRTIEVSLPFQRKFLSRIQQCMVCRFKAECPDNVMTFKRRVKASLYQ